ncbi:hypothetical protein NUW58_g7837 [Xylaria curta]|uniref:Uncharacterized protein n=1 Tax=Xylaria curta TaxID=42375 RepID=A0ACC1NDE6_9PEZI|nr:hypothetical protein NUW58_g7837 [Xylaria curta]
MSLPAQIVVAIGQLVVTTLQLLFMIVTWLQPSRAQAVPDYRLEPIELVNAAQHGLEPPHLDASMPAALPAHLRGDPQPIQGPASNPPSSGVPDNGPRH